MTKDAAIYLLKNAAWIGTVKECMELEEAIEILTETPWIPCSERLPESGTYFVTKRQRDGSTQIAMGSYYALTNEWSGNGNFHDVIAWMELPKPYEP